CGSLDGSTSSPSVLATVKGELSLTTSAPSTPDHVHVACAAYVAALRGQSQAFRERKNADGWVAGVVARTRRRRRARIFAVASPLLAAAALVLFVRGRPWQATVVPAGGSATSLESGEMRFKGEPSVVVIRERAGRQERIVGSFDVQASDAIRVEVSVDRE